MKAAHFLMANLSAFPAIRYYTDDWQSYRKYIPPSEHIVGKADTWKIEKKSQLQNAYQASEPKNDLFFKKRENPRQCDRNVYQSLLFPKRSILGKYLINGFDPAPTKTAYPSNLKSVTTVKNIELFNQIHYTIDKEGSGLSGLRACRRFFCEM